MPKARLVPGLVLLAWASLLAAWVVTNPPFAAPDESEHYVRAIGLSEGHLIGKSDPNAGIGLGARQVAWADQAARLVSLPAGLDPRPFACETGKGSVSAACVKTARPNPSPVSLATAVGNYQPLPYLLPAAVMRAAGSPAGVLRLGRAAGALAAFLLLAVALLALYEDSGSVLSILGLLLAVTPMVLFCAAILNGSGLEIAGGVAFFSCLLRLSRQGRPARRWWVAAAVSGAALALSRSASPLWLAAALCIVIAWSGPRAFISRWIHERAAWLTVGAVAVAVGLNRVWESLYGSRVISDVASLHQGLVAGAHEWWRALPELVGKFGYIDVDLPLVLPILWFALAFGMIVAAWRARGLQRVVLIVAVVGDLTAPVAFYAVWTRPTGYGIQGRQLLPLLVMLPLLAGETCYRNRERMSRPLMRFLLFAVPIGVAVVHVGAWYVNAKRFAVGSTGSAWFLSGASWSPPGGWVLWTVTVCLAGASLLSLALVGRERREPLPPAPTG